MNYDVTVIVPVYNTQAYLKRCLDSIVQQTALQDCSLRVICIDDGSTDQSADVIREYTNRYSFIELFQKENGGLAHVRNVGLSLIRDSEYIATLDSDDFWAPNFLEEFLKAKETHPDMILMDIALVTYDGKWMRDLKVQPDTRYRTPRDFMVGKPAAWAKIVKASLYEGITFPNGKLYEDLAVMPYIVSKATTIVYIEKSLICYVVNNPTSIMNSSKKTIFTIYDALEHLFSFFEGTDEYYEELQYLALEHLCVGHTYRLLRYPDMKKEHFEGIIEFMEKHFGKDWEKNKYIRRGVQKVNINSGLSHVVPLFLYLLKKKKFGLFMRAKLLIK